MATIKGKWLFNDVLDTYDTEFEQSVEFTASFVDENVTYDARFTCVKYKPTKSNLVTYTVGSAVPTNSYWESDEDTVVYMRAPNLDTDEWLFEGINEVDFGTTEQTVSDEFMTWLTANAVEVVESTSAATITHNGEVIAELSAGQTATLKCAGMKMATDVVVAVAENIGSGGACDKPHIIEVAELPTENIDENAVYLCGGAYYKYSKEFVDILMCFPSGEPMSTTEDLSGSLRYTTTKPTENIAVTAPDTSVSHIYYIEDENDLFVYGDLKETGENEWYLFSEVFGYPVYGVVSDASEIDTTVLTEIGLYAVVNTCWTKYLAPTGTLTITEAGTYDVSGYANVVIEIG